MKSLVLLIASSLTTVANAAQVEWTYCKEGVSMVSETVDSEKCEVGSCGAYAYYMALESITATIAADCLEQGYADYKIVETRRGENGVDLMTSAVCVNKVSESKKKC
jgi:hypothetical protein